MSLKMISGLYISSLVIADSIFWISLEIDYFGEAIILLNLESYSVFSLMLSEWGSGLSSGLFVT